MTSRWVAAHRARESERADRLFEDPLAGLLAGPEGFRALALGIEENPWSDRTAASLAIRVRFMDDAVSSAVAEGIRQVVLPGAGMDTRPFRLTFPEGVSWFEIDQAAVLDCKRDLLRRERATASCSWVTIAADLTEDWQGRLEASGFDERRPSCWIVEGLLPYLDERGARKLLSEISAISAPGSRFAADMISASFLTSRWTLPVIERMKARGIGFQFGTDDPEGLLAEFGWKAVAAQLGEEGANFGRWTFPTAPRWVKEVPRNFLVKAAKLP